MGYFFCVKKSVRERSLEHFGSSEHKLLTPKRFIEILSYEWKGSRGR